MAATNRRTNAIIERLITAPHRFDFFQAVRLLERYAAEDDATALYPVGYDYAPRQEAVRLHSLPALSFPKAAITDVEVTALKPAKLTTTVMGLIGANGVLPDHYTELVLQRRQMKDTTLQTFFDLFHHRTLSLFYRAWEKYRLDVHYERSYHQATTDPIAQLFYSLVGNGLPALRDRFAFPEQILLYYSGLLARKPGSAEGLAAVLSDYFQIPIAVQQFQGEWLRLRDSDRSRLPQRGQIEGNFCQLGKNCVLGHQTWSVQHKFCLVIGPLTYQQFKRVLPNGDMFLPLCQLTRYYVEVGLSFDLKIMLSESPYVTLSRNKPIYLGWNSWLQSGTQRKSIKQARVRVGRCHAKSIASD